MAQPCFIGILGDNEQNGAQYRLLTPNIANVYPSNYSKLWLAR